MSATDHETFRRAFELAYFIHPNLDIALRVAEVAVCRLEHTFGRQGRRFYYVPAGRAQNRGSLSHAPRTKVSLKEEHLLQILVYAESDSYERSSEYGTSRYALTDEDMVLRYVKHLIQITLKRNSFYVTLGIGRLLYEYETSQVRQMYDVLMQDHGRFRDNSYLRKQKKLLMKELSERFDQMIRWTRTPQGEDRYLSQPATDRLNRFVHECLVRFTPWETTCVLPASFDPVARIPAFAFAGANPDNESPIEMSRIHTIIDPHCFSRLVASLGFASPGERLAVPQFFYSESNPPSGDRFNPPPLAEEHKLRLERARNDRARRHKAYRVGLLRVYCDDLESVSFDPRRMVSIKIKIVPGVKVIEVRGRDEQGDLPLATFVVTDCDLATGESLSDSLTLEGGQKLSIVLTADESTTGETEDFAIEVSYAETRPLRALSLLGQRAWFGFVRPADDRLKTPENLKTGYSWLVKVVVALALVLGAVMIIWRQLKPGYRTLPVPAQVELRPSPSPAPGPAVTPTPERPQSPKAPADQIAKVGWNNDVHEVANAIRLEVRRGDLPHVEIHNRPTTLLVAVSQADAEDRPYHRYHIKLLAGEKVIWEQTLQAPKVRPSSRAYILKFELSPERFPRADSYKVQVAGDTPAGRQIVGQLILQPVTHQ